MKTKFVPHALTFAVLVLHLGVLSVCKVLL